MPSHRSYSGKFTRPLKISGHLLLTITSLLNTAAASAQVGGPAKTAEEIRTSGTSPTISVDMEYVYSTSSDIVLKGILAPNGNSVESTGLSLVAQEIAVPAGTRFEIVDRLIDDSGVRFVQLSIDTGSVAQDQLKVWILESALVTALADDKDGSKQIASSLEDLNPATSKFYYMGEVQVAGPSQLVMPVKGARRTSPPGMRMHPILRYRKFHAGWDLAAPTGTPVVSAAAGVVTKAGWGNGYGNLIIINHGRLETRYAHLSKILVRSGQSVSAGQLIGKVGSTGRSTGPHLHFEKRGPGGRVLTGPITSGF
jgi:murein DD-endopeptidase MepM/ murein hydrolase activator NlpD